MATDLQTKPGVPKYEAFVDKQLSKVRTRIRALDAGRSLMLLGALTLGYFLLMAAFDLAVKGADDVLFVGIRFAAFGLYAVLMVCLLGQFCLRLYRRINPFYAAKQLEETIPDAKNSVINWLDLKEQELPGAIRNAVGQRAARELKQGDPDKAVNPKSNWVLGGILTGLAIGLLVLFAMGPNQFSSLLQRAFVPFFKSDLGTRTVITLLRPAGDVTVPLNQRVEFQARIEGRHPKLGQPGAPRLLYRYQASDPHVALALDETLDGTWTATLLGDQVQNGFWYKIAAGDTETSEYQVKVQSLPQATRFEATYRYRPYRKLADAKVVFPNEHAVIPRLKEYRGTEVTLVVRTNRELREARVEVESNGVKQELFGEIGPADPKALSVKLTLEHRGTFRVLFTSKDGEDSTDRSPYQIEVLDDETPRVVLTKPGQDGTLPANGTLHVEGTAHDDIGLKSAALRFKVLEGGDKPALQPKTYREGKPFQFDDGTFPDFLEYKDFVALDKLKTSKGEPFPLKAGMVLQYWLEATDNSDYPNKDGNVGRSLAYKLTIADPSQDDKKQKQERKNAEDQQKKHEQKQDQRNADENKKRNDAQADKDPERQKKDDKAADDFQKELENLKEQEQKAKQKEREDRERAKAKGQEPNPAQAKQGDSNDKNQAEEKKADNPGQAGDKKDEGKQGQGDKAAQAKDQGAKDQGNKEQGDQKAGAPKGGGAGEKQSAQAKGSEKKPGEADKGSAKEQPGDKQPGEAKNEGKPGDQKPCNCKGGNSNNPGGGQANGNQANGNKEGQAKGSSTGGAKAADAKAGGQNPQAGNKEGKGPDAQAAGATKGGDPGGAQNPAQAKDDPRPPAVNPREATARDVADLKEKLKRQDQAEEALDELSRLAKEAKDPDVKKAAAEALAKLGQEQNGPQPMVKEQKGPNGTAKDGKQEGTDNAKASEPKSGEPNKGGNQAKGQGDGNDPQEAKANSKSGDKPGNFGPGGKGATDDPSKVDPIAEFAKRPGDLQLEKLKEVMTPEKLKKLDWTPEQWQQFLKDARNYQDMLRRREAANKSSNQKGAMSQIGSTAVRSVDGNPGAQVDPLQADRAPPPPEFREPQRQFTTNPPGKK
jgi:collagen type III alpha